jgi:hypothetical protein
MAGKEQKKQALGPKKMRFAAGWAEKGLFKGVFLWYNVCWICPRTNVYVDLWRI